MDELIWAPGSRQKMSITITDEWPQAGELTGTEAKGHILNLELGWQEALKPQRQTLVIYFL